jgi:hypothetical protein
VAVAADEALANVAIRNSSKIRNVLEKMEMNLVPHGTMPQKQASSWQEGDNGTLESCTLALLTRLSICLEADPVLCSTRELALHLLKLVSGSTNKLRCTSLGWAKSLSEKTKEAQCVRYC